MKRRAFFGYLGSTSVLAAVAAVAAPAFAARPGKRDAARGLKLGIASYTFRKFTLEETIAMTRQAGFSCLTLKDVHLPFKSAPAELRSAREKIEAAGLTLMGGGVVYMNNNPNEIRGYFEYARGAGMPVIVCSPDPAALDMVEKMALEFDVRIAIHNHGPGDTRYPSPLDVLKLVEKRDARLGVCIDVGHTARLGQDPVAVTRACAKRLHDFHIKDVTAAAAGGQPTEVGKGVIDIPGLFRELMRQKFSGHVALEYEANGDAPLPGVLESAAYMRGVLAAL